jgi:hypothetical protein
MTTPKKTTQPNPGNAGGFSNPPLQGAPKRSHHKRKEIPSGTPEAETVCRGVPSGAPEAEPVCRGVHSGAPETPENADRLKNPPLQKDGLPAQAFAIVPDPADPAGWLLPHHTRQALKDVDGSVEWPLIEKSTLLLSLQGNEGCRVSADPAHIIDAARHIAGHYRDAGKPIPIDLCVLI